MAVMRPGSENTPSRSVLSTKRLDTKLDVAADRLNSIVQAANFDVSYHASIIFKSMSVSR
jgi:hypothetical protein